MDHEKLLADAAKTYRRRLTEMETARDALAARVRAAAADGLRQVEIVRATGHVWTREYVRQITRQE